MNSRHAGRRTVPAAVAWLALALSGCTFIEDLYSGQGGPGPADAVPLGERAIAEPIARNYFVLESSTAR